MLYKKVNATQLNNLIDACLAANITYDIWDVESSLLGNNDETEFGVKRSDWESLNKYLN